MGLYVAIQMRLYHLSFTLQGEQHFHPVKYFGGEEKFLRQQQYDQQKRDYCQSHNILLYEIRYNEVLEEKLEEYLILSNDYHSGE